MTSPRHTSTTLTFIDPETGRTVAVTVAQTISGHYIALAIGASEPILFPVDAWEDVRDAIDTRVLALRRERYQ